MKRQILNDEFYNNQPPLLFVEDLKKPFFEHKPSNFNRTIAKKNEINIDGIYLVNNFKNNLDLLSSVISDFQLFTNVFEIKGNKYPVYLEYEENNVFESYNIEIKSDKTIIKAGDTEGIRRAIIFLEDQIISNEGPFLQICNINRKPWLKNRMTRGFFSPTNRPPKNIDELFNDIDYYPNEYLSRLMHDGTNGLWIYTRFKDLLPSSIIKEYGKDYEKRVSKLNAVISKCAKYGIKVFIFVIEPAALDAELYDKYSFLMGHKLDNQYCLCPNQEKSEEYLYESGKLLSTLCPNLGGVISLTTGERLSSCASIHPNNCPICKNIPRGEILSKSVELLRKGIRETNPNIELISWTYGHRDWKEQDIIDYVKTAPSDVYLMQNFDDYGFDKQLGKKRMAIDYWLSYIGPSYLFKLTNNAAKKYNKKMWAKMQICCSHEIASLPYIPSPQNVYEKLKRAKDCGITGIMECWYFGNYPSIMSKAAGELAFCDNFNKNKFLNNLASITYGKRLSKKITQAWQLFYKGYSNYPLNIMFSYYGPMHDGVVWDLALKPKNFSLPRTWQLIDKPDGDRINECVMYGHSLEEVIILINKMNIEFDRANNILEELKNTNNDSLIDLISVSKAISILTKSGNNILNFYKLRDDLGNLKDNPKMILSKMKEIVNNEISNSNKMIELCRKDNRLGYHSEAEGYKFFPQKLEKRIENLNILLKTEFFEIEERINKSLFPLEYYKGIEPESKSYLLKSIDINNAKWEPLSDKKSFFKMVETDKKIIIEMKSNQQTRFSIMPEFQLLKPTPGIYVYSADEKIIMPVETIKNLSIFGNKLKKEKRKWQVIFINKDRTHIRVVLKKKDFNINNKKPFKISLSTYNNPWIIDSAPCKTLCKQHISPGEYGWIFYENNT